MIFNKTNVQQTDHELILTRTLRAPRELVWEMFTNPEHIAQWWGPKGWKATVYEMDVRAGGVWRYSFHGPDGERWVKATYRKVSRPEELVYLNEFTDAAGEPLPGDSGAGLVTASFKVAGDQTELTAVIAFQDADALARAAKMGTVRSTSETWDRLEEYMIKQIKEKS